MVRRLKRVISCGDAQAAESPPHDPLKHRIKIETRPAEIPRAVKRLHSRRGRVSSFVFSLFYCEGSVRARRDRLPTRLVFFCLTLRTTAKFVTGWKCPETRVPASADCFCALPLRRA